MDSLPTATPPRERGAALIIVLAFVVLLTGLALAYFTRATSDRTVAHSSFNQSKADQLAASAMNNIIGDLRQEIVNGSTSPAPTFGPTASPGPYYLYVPTSNANMVPQQSGNPAGVPNLIRRSVRSDPILAPGLPSYASAVNSTTDISANNRWVSTASWNDHYLIPLGPSPSPASSPVSGFTAPDWVFVTSDPTNRTAGRKVITSPDQTVIGRYAYAIYDEGGLVDMNVAGYPSPTPTPPAYVGRKGILAFADLTALGMSSADINSIVGWRNYVSAQPSGSFPSFTFDTTSAANYCNYLRSNTTGFLTVNPASTGTGISTRTDQAFVARQELLNLQSSLASSTFSANALQYLGTFSRETNSPSFSPTTPTGSTIDYATLANTSSTAINPNFLFRRVTTSFTRFDGTTANVGEPLVKTRFPLSRLAWITYAGPSASRTLPPQSPTLATTDPNYDMWALQWLYGVPASYLQLGTAPNIKACFGLTFQGSPTYAWTYTNPSGTGAASSIMTLDQVAAAAREPDFFELLQAGILSGSLGQSTGGGVTGQNDPTTGAGLVFPDIHMSSTMQHILTIGACIIDQASPGSIPTQIQFTGGNGNTWTAYGVKNLPYITQLYPIAGTSPNDPNPSTPTQWATYLLLQLWNPHQNPPATLPVTVRLRVDGAIGIFTGGNGQTWATGTTPQIIANGANAGQSVTLNSAFSFSAPTPLTSLNTTNAAAAPGSAGSFAVLAAPPIP